MDKNKFVGRDNYILIQGFMVSELDLKGAELLVYAIIYGFSQTEGQCFTGSLKYLSEWTNCTVRGVIKCMNSLKEKGLIKAVSDEDGSRKGYTSVYCFKNAEQSSSMEQSSPMEQSSSMEQSSPMEQSSHIEQSSPMEQSSLEYGTKFTYDVNKVHSVCEQSSPNNIDNNIIYYNNINNNAHTRECFSCYEENIGYVSPAVAEDMNAYLNQGIEDKLICEAIKDAAKAQRFSWHYINAIIVDKLKRNITTYTAYIADRESFQRQRDSAKPSAAYQSETDLYEEYKPSDEDLAAYYASMERERR